jgi:hypothetical protein
VNNNKESTPPVNLLTLIPVRRIDWEKTPDGFILLLKPKYKHPFLKKHLMPHIKRKFYRVKLDEIGSFFWENCDGQSPIEEIARKHKDKFGDKVEPLYDRISLFLQSLEKHGFIELKKSNTQELPITEIKE